MLIVFNLRPLTSMGNIVLPTICVLTLAGLPKLALGLSVEIIAAVVAEHCILTPWRSSSICLLILVLRSYPMCRGWRDYGLLWGHLPRRIFKTWFVLWRITASVCSTSFANKLQILAEEDGRWASFTIKIDWSTLRYLVLYPLFWLSAG